MFKVNINLIWGHYCPWDAIIKYLQRSLFTLSDLLPCFVLYQIHYLRLALSFCHNLANMYCNRTAMQCIMQVYIFSFVSLYFSICRAFYFGTNQSHIIDHR